MTNDEQKNAIEIWKKVIGTQEHFNQMMLQVRNHLLTILTALLGAAALMYQKGSIVPFFCLQLTVSSLILFVGAVVVAAFYVTEQGYYHLLIGAVKQGEVIEATAKPHVPGIGLTQSISAESGKPIFFIPMRSLPRLRCFYGVLFVLFISGGLFTLRNVPASDSVKEATDSKNAVVTSAVPNDPKAGTKALKKFRNSGSYDLMLSEVCGQAEKFADEKLTRLDKSRAVAVFDIDETALSTWEILESGEFTWDAKRFTDFVRAGKATRIEPVHRLYMALQSKGIAVVFITSRAEELREATVKNLADQGFTGYADLIMRSSSSKSGSREFKTQAREQLRNSGKTPFLCIGDQLDDLDPSLAEGNFLLPNPFY